MSCQKIHQFLRLFEEGLSSADFFSCHFWLFVSFLADGTLLRWRWMKMRMRRRLPWGGWLYTFATPWNSISLSEWSFFNGGPLWMAKNECVHQKLNGTESQRTPKEVARAIRYSGLGVRSVGPVGEFLECVTGVMTPWKWSSGPLLNYNC